MFADIFDMRFRKGGQPSGLLQEKLGFRGWDGEDVNRHRLASGTFARLKTLHAIVAYKLEKLILFVEIHRAAPRITPYHGAKALS